MRPDRVLVTGAGGFIGDRLTHRLALQESVDVCPLVHRISGPHAMRLARLPVDIEQGSILDRTRMEALLEGCDAVIHCAVGTKETTIEGTQILVDAAVGAGVDRFVHVSSASVHGHEWRGELTETAHFAPDTAYGKWKVAAERLVRERTRQSALDPTIFRPFIVYGPFSEFVTTPVETIRSGAILADGGAGTLNGIYVDNLIDALITALHHEDAPGEVFMLRDDSPMSWRTYYTRLARAIDNHPPIVFRSSARIASERRRAHLHDSVIRPIRALQGILTGTETKRILFDEFDQVPWANSLYGALPDALTERIRPGDSAKTIPYREQSDDIAGSYPLPAVRYVKMHRSTGTISSAKARSLLGWQPRVAQEEALARVCHWIEELETIPSVPNDSADDQPETIEATHE